MKRLLLPFAVALLFALPGMAQQDALYSQYNFNPLLVNPGYAGSREALSIVGVHRSQFAGINGAAQTQSLSAHSLIKKDRIGLGLQLFQDQGGPVKNIGIMTNYAYRIRFANSNLSLGIQAGLFQHNVDWSEFNLASSTDQSFVNAANNKTVPDVNFGVYYSSAVYYIGGAVTHLMESKIGLANSPTTNDTKLMRHYFLMGGYVIPFSEKVKFRPSFLFRSVGNTPVNIDLNTAFLFHDKLWVGTGLRTGPKLNADGLDNQLLVLVEYKITNKLRAGYNFDLALNELIQHNSGSHEVMIGLDLNLLHKEPVSPRHF